MRRVLGLLLPFLIVGCSSGGGSLSGISQMVGPSGGQVVSADGDLTLDIPAGALPADTEITIRGLPPSDLGPEVTAAYELGPDGLLFQQPVTVTLRLDQSPLGPGGVLQADVVVLLSRSGTETEPAGAQVLTGDADAGVMTVTGEIMHFSSLFGRLQGLSVKVDGVPDSISADEPFDVTFHAVATNSGDEPKATLRAWGDSPLSPGEESPFEVSVVALGSDPVGVGPFRCNSPGDGKFHATGILNDLGLPEGVGQDFDFTVRLAKTVVHKATPGQARVLPLSLGALEAAEAIVDAVPGLVPDPKRAVTLAGEEVAAVVDVVTGAVLGQVSTPPGKTYGAILLAHGGVFVLFAYGDWGAALYYWDGSAFGAAVMLSTNNITDASRTPGGGLLFVDRAAGQGRFLEFVVNAYVVSAIVMNLPGIISATQLPDGSILAVTNGTGGGLYAAASPSATLVFVGLIADTLRRVRALDDVAAISYFGSGVAFGGISVAARTNGTWVLVFGLSGQSAAGVGLKKRPTSDFLQAVNDDHILIAATSYYTNEYRVIEVEADGNYWADSLVALPEGCEAPGHALWLPDTNELAISCHDSHALVVIPQG